MPLLITALMIFHSVVPHGSLLETFLPWLVLAVPVLLVFAWRRSPRRVLLALLPLVVWLGMFGGRLLPAPDGPAALTAVQHNVSDENPDPAATARALRDAAPDVIALEEVTPEALPAYTTVLAPAYSHSYAHGTVALWSRHPLTTARPVDLRPESFGADWNRGLRATAHTPHGDIAVYVAHLPSVRLGAGGFRTAPRDESARLLGAALAAEPLDRVLLLGDLNATLEDRGLSPVTAEVSTAGRGFAFSWPASFPLARIDQVMARAMTVTDVRTLPRTGSDHLPVAARLRV